jgi:hypothetical protein
MFACESHNIFSGRASLIKQGRFFGSLSSDTCKRLILVCSKQIDGALAIFRVRATFRPEMARVMFWKSKIVEATGDADKARKLRDESLDMYRDITQKAVSADCELEEAFDDLIAFWSR